MTGEFERGFSDEERPDWEPDRPEESGAHPDFPADVDGADWDEGAEDGDWQNTEEESAGLPEEDDQAPLATPAPRLTGGSGKSRKRLGWDGVPKGRHLVVSATDKKKRPAPGHMAQASAARLFGDPCRDVLLHV